MDYDKAIRLLTEVAQSNSSLTPYAESRLYIVIDMLETYK